MDLRGYLTLIRKYLPLILAASLLGLLGGFGLYAATPKSYAADVQFYVSTPVPDGTSAQSGGQFATGRMTSYGELLSSQELGERVVKAAGLTDLSGLQVAKKITATSSVDSVLLKATVTDTDPQRALAIAQGIDKVFGPMVDKLDNTGRTVPIVQINTVSAPKVNPNPVAPKPKMNLLLGLALGLGLSLAFAVVRELLDQSVKSPEQAREVVGAPVIGTIPADKASDDRQLLVGSDRTTARAEAHRQLRTNLAFLDSARSAKVMVFTSPAGADGTSTVAANTALAFAEAGERVCLVEGDLRSPGALAAFARFGNGLDPEALTGDGLSAVLAGRAELGAVLRTWRSENTSLDLLGAGQVPPNAAELLASPRLEATLAELRSRYDRVVVDAPALLPVADASVLAAAADGVVLVARSGRTTTAQLQAARSALEPIRARILGVVMNRARTAGRTAARRG
ncbi:polysaccharide biosynthesis tyrosine autokinase [Luteococcus peritonei]|uniref:Polysaccharide biosynthesis tyrosine autokinase n=1 Tax=Luteococcus peritonei TaxID=88874 RepID=A0ABW4RSD2_9ACTN